MESVKRRVAWDTSAAIYYLESISPYRPWLERQYQELLATDGMLVLSVVVYHELLGLTADRCEAALNTAGAWLEQHAATRKLHPGLSPRRVTCWYGTTTSPSSTSVPTPLPKVAVRSISSAVD